MTDPAPAADLLFVNGPVLTMEGGRVAEALAVSGNRILAVGERRDVERLAGAGTRVVDLRGRALLPGFVDAHTHFVQYGMRLLRLDLSRAATREDALEEVRERARMTPEGGWVVGHSWDESKWPDARRPTREELDAAAGGRPVVLARVDRHMGVLSTAGLRAVGLDPARHPDGAAFEDDYYAAIDRVTPAVETLAKAVRQASRKAWDLGVTSVHVIASADDFRALQLAREEGALGVRATLYFHMQAIEPALAAGFRRGMGDAWLRVNGVKAYTDGSIGSRTARVSFGYAGKPDEKGLFLYEDKALLDLAARAHRAGLQLAIHAIGDAAIDQAIRAIAHALDQDAEAAAAPRARGNAPAPRDARHRIEHLELFTDADAKRLRDLGIVASAQPNFVGEWGFPGQMYESRLGREVVERHNRFAVLAKEGVHLAFGSDDMPFGPLYGLHWAVNGPSEAQRIDVERALEAYTIGAARAGFAEEEVGSLAPGKLADLVVLSEDPRAAPGRLKDLRVDMTVVDGRVVLER